MSIKLVDFSYFVIVAKYRSFRQAAEEVGLTPSAVSHSIRQLEERLKVRLFNRTTRSVSLTEAGRKLHEKVAPAFDDISLTLDELNLYRETPMGIIRLNVVRQGGRLQLAPLIADFTRQYPDIQVEVQMDDRLVDIVKAQLDAGVRLNRVIEKDMKAIPVGPPVRYAVVATPAYFAQHGIPAEPQWLTEHKCIQFRYPSGKAFGWYFEQAESREEVVVSGPVVVDDLDIALDMALNGVGLAYVLREMAEPHLQSGKLISVLDDWLPELPGFHLYFPNRKHPSAAFRAFLDFLKARN
ncbi:LysR family transcriptional regulator [Enterobacter sp. Ap-916]|uniref:LysR family transcriptional regulator n=1 Tax=unclassified Enterobacter TaxID=2608935 RepID=UPI0014201347|nr:MULTISPECIES: LysR family transcriptional regulator [unclassified Enterobacter]NIF57956.1 LysR family transcriptional regulator [Enterobacter sp. Ap-867]NIG28102.1 LysR family transcriptional regulator [Enterobacter sp. Ap-916]